MGKIKCKVTVHDIVANKSSIGKNKEYTVGLLLKIGKAYEYIPLTNKKKKNEIIGNDIKKVRELLKHKYGIEKDKSVEIEIDLDKDLIIKVDDPEKLRYNGLIKFVYSKVFVKKVKEALNINDLIIKL